MRDCREHRSQEIHQHRLFSLNQLSEKTTMPTGFVPDFPLKRRPPEPQKKPFCLLAWWVYTTLNYWGLWSQVTPVGTIAASYNRM